MDIKGFGHLFKCNPPGWFNADGAITVNLKCAPKPDFESYAREEQTFALDERAKKGREFVGQFVDSIEGLLVDGKPVTTFEELFKNGPADLYDWVYSAVLSQKILNEAEIKN